MIDYIERAYKVLRDNGLGDWDVEVSNHKKTYGMCLYGAKTILISKYLIAADNESEIMDTIYHEVAHALTPGDGHGPAWKRKCIELGGSGKRLSDAKINAPSKWELLCINGHTHQLYRWNKESIYKCMKCGIPMYIKRSDNSVVYHKDIYVLEFNALAQYHHIPWIDRQGVPQI